MEREEIYMVVCIICAIVSICCLAVCLGLNIDMQIIESEIDVIKHLKS